MTEWEDITDVISVDIDDQEEIAVLWVNVEDGWDFYVELGALGEELIGSCSADLAFYYPSDLRELGEHLIEMSRELREVQE